MDILNLIQNDVTELQKTGDMSIASKIKREYSIYSGLSQVLLVTSQLNICINSNILMLKICAVSTISLKLHMCNTDHCADASQCQDKSV